MHMWFYPNITSDRILPVSRIVPYARITPDRELEPEAEEQSRYPQKQEQQQHQPMNIDPPLTSYARHAAILLQAALEVADQAAGLLALETYPASKIEGFMIAVNWLKEQIEGSETLMIEGKDDSIYLRSDSEMIRHWDEIARHVLALSPIELMNDDQLLQSYTVYNEDKQKTWHIPHQGLIMQAYA